MTDHSVEGARTHTFLAALDQTQWQRVAQSATSQQGPARKVLFSQGDRARRFHWVERGLVQLARVSSSGQEQVVEVVRAGELFAEALVFINTPALYPVTATFVRPSSIVSFSNDALRELLESSHELSLKMLSLMAQRMHRLVTTIDELTLQSAKERVVHWVLDEAEGRKEFVLEFPKKVLAARLGLTPESLSRVLASLRRDRFIDVERDRVTVHDRRALEDLADAR
ncbi:MAG: Crp/Fnr family transcriptional regulator [Myxococcota bacterium]